VGELLQELLQHLRGMWNRRFIGLATAWIAAIVGVPVAFAIHEKFEASARVFVDTQSLLRPVMAGLSIQPNLDQQVALMSRTLLSRPNLEKLVAMNRLDADVRAQSERETLIDNLLKTLQINGSPTTNLYTISFRDSDPQRARDVVQSLLTIFVESSLGGKRQDTQTTLQFLDEQIDRYEQSLRQAESRLKDFRLKYLGIAGQRGPAGQDYFSRMSKVSDDISSAKLELRAAVESRDSYRRDLSAQSSTIASAKSAGIVASAAPTEIDQRIASQKTKLDELLRTFTDQHPDVAGTRRVIAELEEQRKQERLARERAIALSGKPAEPTESNPVYEKLRVALSDAEAKAASLQGRLAAYESEYAQLKNSARLVPQVEAELAQLNRDYDIQKKTYTDLLARREAATMGVGVQETEGGQFRVIDPPRVSPQPIPPTRLTMLSIAFGAALALGLFASFLASELAPTIHDARALREATDRPVLGVLSIIPNEVVRQSGRRRLVLFLSGLGGLLATFAATMALAIFVLRAV
jgi:polysaccharide chain length determinant protein (PEP-CTERM system associated)